MEIYLKDLETSRLLMIKRVSKKTIIEMQISSGAISVLTHYSSVDERLKLHQSVADTLNMKGMGICSKYVFWDKYNEVQKEIKSFVKSINGK